jgi:hypothetical protein
MAYADLADGPKEVVDLVWDMFSDLFDNANYGPFLNEFTKFDKERVVELLDPAIGQLSAYVPIARLGDYSLASFPYSVGIWHYCLTLSLVIEVIEHLMRSYVEIPDTQRVQAPDIVRRDYLTRWQTLLNEYKDRLKQAGKKLSVEAFDDEYSAGHYQKVLVDYPSIAAMWAPMNPAERPQIWAGWW